MSAAVAMTLAHALPVALALEAGGRSIALGVGGAELELQLGVVMRGERGLAGTNGTNGTNGVGVPLGGAAGQILKKQSGADFDTVWSTPAAAVAGSDRQLQFNDGGVLAASSGMEWDKAASTLSVPGVAKLGRVDASSMTASALSDVAAPTLTAGAAGALAGGTYGVTVVAVDAAGQTTQANFGASVVVAGPSGSIGVSWAGQARAASYRVYLATSAQWWNAASYFTVTGGTSLVITTLAGATAGSTPSTNSTGAIRMANGWGMVQGNLSEGFYLGHTAINFVARLSTAGLHLGSSLPLTWSLAGGALNSADTGVIRGAAGVVEFNNGTAGTLRDVKLRGLQFGAMFTVATLPSASASSGALYRVSDASAPAVGSVVAAGGAAKCTVQSDGAAWRVVWIA